MPAATDTRLGIRFRLHGAVAAIASEFAQEPTSDGPAWLTVGTSGNSNFSSV